MPILCRFRAPAKPDGPAPIKAIMSSVAKLPVSGPIAGLGSTWTAAAVGAGAVWLSLRMVIVSVMVLFPSLECWWRPALRPAACAAGH
ncbi:hypothetical protein D3C72_2198200 [compost metagenome]